MCVELAADFNTLRSRAEREKNSHKNKISVLILCGDFLMFAMKASLADFQSLIWAYFADLRISFLVHCKGLNVTCFSKDYQSKSYKWEHVTIRGKKITAYMPLNRESYYEKKEKEMRKRRKTKEQLHSQYLYVQFKCVSY